MTTTLTGDGTSRPDDEELQWVTARDGQAGGKPAPSSSSSSLSSVLPQQCSYDDDDDDGTSLSSHERGNSNTTTNSNSKSNTNRNTSDREYVDDDDDEDVYDGREDANDDEEKGRIHFPPPHALFGREGELAKLRNIYESLLSLPPPPSPPLPLQSQDGSDVDHNMNTDRRCHISPSRNEYATPFMPPTPPLASPTPPGSRVHIVLAEGCAGVGKSALVHEGFVRKYLMSACGDDVPGKGVVPLYGSGKFNNDTLSRAKSDPFSAFLHAVDEVGRNLLHRYQQHPQHSHDHHPRRPHNHHHHPQHHQHHPQHPHNHHHGQGYEHNRNNYNNMNSCISSGSSTGSNDHMGTVHRLIHEIRERFHHVGLDPDTEMGRLLIECCPNFEWILSLECSDDHQDLQGKDGVPPGLMKDRPPCSVTPSTPSSPSSITSLEKVMARSHDDGAHKTIQTTTKRSRRMTLDGRRYLLDPQLPSKVFGSVFRCLGTTENPLVLFLDDLQWADGECLDLLRRVLLCGGDDDVDSCSSTTQPYRMLLIASYRSNEVSGNANLQAFVQALEDGCKRSECVTSSLSKMQRWGPILHKMHISNLSPDDVCKFLLATFRGLQQEDAQSLMEWLYSRTLGNIFYCKQALEELQRRNAIYYDMVTFRWAVSDRLGDISLRAGQTYMGKANRLSAELTMTLREEDVLHMIRHQLQELDSITLRTALALAAYTRNTIDVPLLMLLLDATYGTTKGVATEDELCLLLDQAVKKGLLLKTMTSPTNGTVTCANSLLQEEGKSKESAAFGTAAAGKSLPQYKFSHDLVQQSCHALVPSGDDRNMLMTKVGTALLNRATKAIPSSSDASSRNELDSSRRSSVRGSELTRNVTSSNEPTSITDQFTAAPLPSSATCNGDKKEQGTNENDGESFFRVGEEVQQYEDNKYGRRYRYQESDEWILFVAVELLNAVPSSMVEDPLQLAALNCEVAQVCLDKAFYGRASELLQVALVHLGTKLWEKYEFTLHLLTLQIEVEYTLGRYANALQLIENVLANAKTLVDKSPIYSYKIDVLVEMNNQNHMAGVKESIRALGVYGHHFPLAPSKNDVARESFLLKLARRGRPMTTLADLPPKKTNVCAMRLMAQLMHYSTLAQNSEHHPLTTLVALRAMRLAFEELRCGPHLGQILTTYAVALRVGGQFQEAYAYASIAGTIMRQRCPDLDKNAHPEGGVEFAISDIILHGGLMALKQPFEASIPNYLQNYRTCLRYGNVNMALASAMHIPLTYFAAGSLPLATNVTGYQHAPILFLEPKLILFEDKARQCKKPSFVALFQLFRQVLYNLQDKSRSTTVLDGVAMHEGQVLSQFEGKQFRMTFRDISLMRLMLGCIFGDLTAMEAMMERLDDVKLFDRPLDREHIRLTFGGIAAFVLARHFHRQGNTDRKRHFVQTGKEIVSNMRKYERIGSVNAIPVCACFKAVDRDHPKLYEDAIAACAKAKMVHLEALMNEHCGMYYVHRDGEPKGGGIIDNCLAMQFLSRAMWLYQDWGATSKVGQMKRRYPYLETTSRRPSQASPFDDRGRNGSGFSIKRASSTRTMSTTIRGIRLFSSFQLQPQNQKLADDSPHSSGGQVHEGAKRRRSHTPMPTTGMPHRPSIGSIRRRSFMVIRRQQQNGGSNQPSHSIRHQQREENQYHPDHHGIFDDFDEAEAAVVDSCFF